MTNQEIEILIAARRGWTPRSRDKDGRITWWWRDEFNEVWPDSAAPKYTERVGDILFTAKQTFKGEQPKVFIRHLVSILDRNHGNADIAPSDVYDPVEMTYHLLMATPLEFCEAYLKTLNLWKD